MVEQGRSNSTSRLCKDISRRRGNIRNGRKGGSIAGVETPAGNPLEGIGSNYNTKLRARKIW